MSQIISPNFMPFIKDTIVQIIGEIMPKIRKQCKEIIASADVNLISTCLNLTLIFLNMKNINLNDKDKIMFPH